MDHPGPHLTALAIELAIVVMTVVAREVRRRRKGQR